MIIYIRLYSNYAKTANKNAKIAEQNSRLWKLSRLSNTGTITHETNISKPAS